MTSKTTSLIFGNSNTEPKYEFFEVSQELYNYLCTPKNLCSIKGKENEEAVLCTDTRTFAIKLVESTNTMLLIPTSQIASQKEEIVGSLSRHYELVEIVPKLHQLKALLCERLYAGQDSEPKQKGRIFTFDQLKARIQASETEIITGLKSLNAFELDGHWRLLAPDYMNDIVEFILTEALSRDWDLAKISQKECIDALSRVNYEPWSISHVLSVYSCQTTSAGKDKLYNLDKTKICQFKAIKLLQSNKVPKRDHTLHD
jgi:sister chromatid cohesion protein DCC1